MAKNKPIDIGTIISVECGAPKAGNVGKTTYHISVIVKDSKWGFGRWVYSVTPVAGSGEFKVAEERIVWEE